MPSPLQTLKRVLKTKAGILTFLGMLLGLLVVAVAPSVISDSSMATTVTMIGAVVSMVSGNGFARIITIMHRPPEE